MFAKIGLACDHAGVALKNQIKKFLLDHSLQVQDFSADVSAESRVDYPDHAYRLAIAIQQQQCDGGIAICGSGLGMAIAVNKVKGLRATCVWSQESAQLSRQHNNSNCLCLGQRLVEPNLALEIVKIWLQTEFLGARHQHRIDKITALESKTSTP